jgi:hypothetical protein
MSMLIFMHDLFNLRDILTMSMLILIHDLFNLRDILTMSMLIFMHDLFNLRDILTMSMPEHYRITDRNDIDEILLRVALNTLTSICHDFSTFYFLIVPVYSGNNCLMQILDIKLALCVCLFGSVLRISR